VQEGGERRSFVAIRMTKNDYLSKLLTIQLCFNTLVGGGRSFEAIGVNVHYFKRR
jgi:hypothetical protein